MRRVEEKKYYEQNVLNVSTFGYYKRKFLHEARDFDLSTNAKLFIPVKEGVVNVKFKNVELSFLPAPSPRWIASVIKALEASDAHS